MNHRGEFNQPVPPDEQKAIAEAVVADFMTALGPSSAPKRPMRWTETEWRRLMFARWLRAHGRLAS